MCRKGMTLIELLISALLASLMTVAMMEIVWSTARELRDSDRDVATSSPTTQLAQQLRVDFINARGLLMDPQGVTLHGFLRTDPLTSSPMLTPGLVRYEVAGAIGRKLLIRVSENSREVVWVGCAAVQVEPLEQVDPEDEPLPLSETGGLPQIPSRLRITLLGDAGQILLREVIHHHEG
jgi:hypothetical protein